jgi:membrane-associated phospholipid phosphatase
VTPTEWLQRRLWSPGHLHWYDIAVWAVYLTHFFAVWLVAAMLWRRSRERFGRYALLTSVLTLAAFLVYWHYPAQPPWLAADLGHLGPVDRIVPAVWDRLGVSSMQSVYENLSLVNTVAAMPSLHAAYPLMLLLFFWPAGWAVRGALAAYTLAMAFALVYGGEHFVADILAGWALAALAFAAVAAVWRTGARLAARRRRTRHARPSHQRSTRSARSVTQRDGLPGPSSSSSQTRPGSVQSSGHVPSSERRERTWSTASPSRGSGGAPASSAAERK